MSEIITDPSSYIPWIARRKSDQSITITCLDSVGAAFNLSAYTFIAEIGRYGANAAFLNPTVVNGGSTGIITISLTDTQLDIAASKDYYWILRTTAPSDQVWFNGPFTLNSNLWNGTVTTTITETVTLGATNITVTISLNGSLFTALMFACSDETTALTAGTSKISFRVPFAMNITSIRGSLVTAQTSGNIFTADINKNGTSILSTKLTIDNTEKTSKTAASALVISSTSLADDDIISADIDQIGDGTGKGFKVAILGNRI